MTTQQFKEIFLPLSDKLYRFAFRFLGGAEEAEDAVQEVLMKLWNMRADMEKIKSKEAMAMTITRNLCLDKLRKKHTVEAREYMYENVTDDEVSPDTSLHQKEMVKKVLTIMQGLPEMQRTILHLRDIEGYETSEIEKVTGINPNNIRVILSRARKTVKEQMVKYVDHGKERTTRTIEEIL